MLANKIAIGAVWLVGARFATKLLDLVSMMIVARILTPADFGLFALAASVVLILSAVTDLSLSDAIVQMSDPGKAAYDTAFTMNVLRGLILMLLIGGVAWPFADFYGDPRLAPILFGLATIPVIRGLISPRMAHLQREMRFRPAFYVESVAKLAAFVASVSVSYMTESYWALVAGMVVAPLIGTSLSYWFAPYRPVLALTHWRSITTFSGWLTLSNAINTINWQSDRFFIGGRLGTTALGQYTVGSELASLPTNAPVLPIMQALYSGFAKLAHDITRLKAAYLTSQCVVMALALPIAITVAIFARSIIDIAIGPEWAQSAFVIQVLAPVFALQLLTAPAHSIAMATGNTNAIFWRDLSGFGVRLPAILIGLYIAGFEGVVWARVVSGTFLIVLNLMLMKRILNVSVLAQLLAPWRSYVSGLGLAALLIVIGSYFDLLETTEIRQLPILLPLVAVGFGTFLALHLALWTITRPAGSAEGKLIEMAKFLTIKIRHAS